MSNCLTAFDSVFGQLFRGISRIGRRWLNWALPALCVSLICLAGCRSTSDTPMNPTTLDTRLNAPAGPATVAVSESRLSIVIETVAGNDDRDLRLRAASTGWVAVTLMNFGPGHIELQPVSGFGKTRADSVDHGPSYMLPPSLFFGVGMTSMQYAFSDTTGRVVASGRLDPPDSPLVLAPNERRTMWRRIAAPRSAGTYTLAVTCDMRPAAVTGSPNIIDFTKTHEEGRVVITAVAEGVRVAEEQGKNQDKASGPGLETRSGVKG